MMNFRFLVATKPLFCSSYFDVQITIWCWLKYILDGGIIGVLDGWF